MSESTAWRCGVRGHNEIRICGLNGDDRPSCLEPVRDYVCGLPMTRLDGVSLARITIDKYGAEARKPSVVLATALLAGAHARDALAARLAEVEKENERLRAELATPPVLRVLTEAQIRDALNEGAAESRAAQGDNAWASLLKQRDEARQECDLMRPVYLAALAWRAAVHAANEVVYVSKPVGFASNALMSAISTATTPNRGKDE